MKGSVLMNRRVSLAEKFFWENAKKAYLSATAENVCILVLKGTCIDIGTEIPIEKGDIVIICAKYCGNIIVSISRYEENHNFYEFFYSNTSLDQSYRMLDDVPIEYNRYVKANIKRLSVLGTEPVLAVR